MSRWYIVPAEGAIIDYVDIQQDQEQAGYQATFWTRATIRMIVATASADKLRIHLSPSSVRQALHRARLFWGRPWLVLPPNTDLVKAAKQWAIAQAVIGAGLQAAVLHADESLIELRPMMPINGGTDSV